MAKYVVDVREVWVSSMEVEADSPEEAIQLVADNKDEGEFLGMEYSHSLDHREFWTATKVGG